MTPRLRSSVLVVTGSCLALVLTACGQDDPAAPQQAGSSGQDSGDGHSHSHDGGAAGLAPAYEVDGDLRMGTFQPLPDAPAAADVAGHVWTAESGDGTRATVELTGLRPEAEYVGHLHARPCALADGGPHFAFDPEGPEEPPNEVHFMLTADQRGLGMATVQNRRRVGSAARSAVLHVPGGEARMVCADLHPTTAGKAKAASAMADGSHGSGSPMDMSNAVTVDVSIRDGQVEPAGDRVEVGVGQPVRLRVDSDTADEIHVHSDPERSFAVKAADGQTFAFTIERPGVYEVESHETGDVIVSLAVMPR